MKEAELLKDEIGKFSRENFYRDYASLGWEDQTLRHIGAHISKAGNKLLDYMANRRPAADIAEQVIPDLAIYRTQIMELFDIACGDVAWVENLPPRDGDEDDALHSIFVAHGIISEYIEKAEHLPRESQRRPPKEGLTEVPAKLHLAASILARLHKVDLLESQRRRIRDQSGQDPTGGP